jgi:hypothetical protein
MRCLLLRAGQSRCFGEKSCAALQQGYSVAQSADLSGRTEGEEFREIDSRREHGRGTSARGEL